MARDDERVLDYFAEILPGGPAAPFPRGPGGPRRLLLLGNGFSIERDEAFRYETLWDHADAVAALPAKVKTLAARQGTRNFEDMLASLDFLRAGALEYGVAADDPLLRAIEHDTQQVRRALVHAISKVHLETPADLTDHEIASCAFFLGVFDEVFTTNYDLLLYWISNKHHKMLATGEKGALIAKFKDGFCIEGDDRNALSFAQGVLAKAVNGMYFLHGALHLFESGGETWKRRVKTVNFLGHKLTFEHLRDSIVKAVAEGQLPLIVTEGDSAKKLDRIRANPYLSFCYERLRQLEGDLVTFGFSFSPQDAHILQAIAENPGIRRVFVGARLSGGRPRGRLIEAVDGLRARRAALVASHPTAYNDLTIHYFDAQTACPWDCPVGVGDHPYWKREADQEKR